MCFSLFSITSLFWEHVSFTKPWDMSWLILKFKILKFYMYLLDISVHIGSTLSQPFFCKELNHWNRTKHHFDLNYDTTNVSHSVRLIIVWHLVSHLHFSCFSNIILTAGYLLESYYSHFHSFVGVYAPSLPNMQ